MQIDFKSFKSEVKIALDRLGKYFVSKNLNIYDSIQTAIENIDKCTDFFSLQRQLEKLHIQMRQEYKDRPTYGVGYTDAMMDFLAAIWNSKIKEGSK